MEEYFTTLIATAEAIQATKDDDLTAADREAIKRRQEAFQTGLSVPGMKAVKIVTKGLRKTYTIYEDAFYQESKKAYLRQKAAQEIIKFYRNPMVNGGHEIVEDTLTYIRSISLDDFEKHIRVERSKLDADRGTESASLEQQFWTLEQYGHTIPAAEQFLYGLVDLLATAIEDLGINDNQKVQTKIEKVTQEWKSEWDQAGTDDTAAMNQLLEKITRKRKLHWVNQRFSDPGQQGTFSESVFYQDANQHAELFDRERFKSRLDEFEQDGKHYEDSQASATQFIKDYWLADHYQACEILGKDPKLLDEIAEKRAASFYGDLMILAIQKTYFPDNYIKPKDKLSNTIFDGKDRLFDRQFKALSMESKNAAKEITTYVKLGLDEGFENVSMPKLSRYESIVHDAVGALCDAGNQFITLGMVNRAMSGDAKAKLTASKKKEIRDALLRLMHSAISIKSEDEDYVYDGHVLEAQLLTKQATVRGQKVPQDFILKIVGDLPLYQYAKRKKQIIKGPIETLNPPISKTRENELLIDYLLRRISWTNQKDTVNILFSTIYSQLGISLDRKNKDKRTRLRKPIMAILDYWKDIGRIKEYHFENDKGEPVTATRQPYRIVIVKHENK